MFRRRVSFGLVSVALIFSALSTSALAQSSLTAKATVPAAPASAVVENDRTRDGLVGPVRRVRTEIVKLSSETGKLAEGKRTVLEIVAYDIKGAKVENQYFPIAGANLTGKEVYKYDDKGNISEMILTNDDGSLVSKEIYKYEFDFVGNWNKMSTSVAVIDAGKMSFEPTEVTYRSIMYYLDEKMLRMAQPAAAPASAPSAPPIASANSVATPSVETKNTAIALKPPVNPSPNNAATPVQKSVNIPKVVTTTDKLNAGAVDVGMPRLSSNSSNLLVKFDTEPPPPAPRPLLKPVSGGVLNGSAVSLPPPSYPDAAKRSRVSGSVIVEVVIDEMGKVISAQAISGPMALREVAIQAALRARFSPTKLSGQPVKVSGTISYKFALAQ
ncbi:MAG: energy transducer TonB [Pyrinomonadaceae bacterium]|nr:energy transducer TonB [Pyrinomonadaceae bacterium]